MLSPPFKLAAQPSIAAICCDKHDAGNAVIDAAIDTAVDDQPAPAVKRRVRLAEMDQYLHCSILGTCLGTTELRKLMARFIDIETASDVDVHHEAVWLAGQGGEATKSLQKALDQRHAGALQRFGAARDAAALTVLWEQALSQGEIPGAYWAVLTHRDMTLDLRKRVFGDVHMLSHLVGAANRADIRRLVAIERENAELRERLEKQQQRTQQLIVERGVLSERLRTLTVLNESQAATIAQLVRASSPSAMSSRDDSSDAVAMQTQRRERAEQLAAESAREAAAAKSELDHALRQADIIARELAVAEMQLREMGADVAPQADALEAALRGNRILYVGGRPSSTPAIRDVVERHGGEIRRHDGGLEDRKGLLAAGVAWARLVMFPVDCIDHDSALNIKHLCNKLGVRFIALRTASVASFVSAVLLEPADQAPVPTAGGAATSC